MEKPSKENPDQPRKSRPTSRKEKGAPERPRSRSPKLPRTGRRERVRPGSIPEMAEQQAEVRVRSTVVDIDSVREEEVKEECLGLLETAGQEDSLKNKNLGVFEWLLMVCALALVLLFFPLLIWFCIKIVREHERVVIFRLGHLLRGRPRGPGLLFYLPVVDVCHKVDNRLTMITVPLHTVVTKDLLKPELSVMCYYRIENVALCCTALSSLPTVLQSLVQAAVRDVVALHNFSHVLLHRRKIGQKIQVGVDSVVYRWGIKVERVDIDELSFPVEFQQSAAAEAEAKRQERVRATAGGDRDAWEGFRASLRLLHPALVLPLPPDLLSPATDASLLPPPPPPAIEGEDGLTEKDPELDSPMM